MKRIIYKIIFVILILTYSNSSQIKFKYIMNSNKNNFNTFSQVNILSDQRSELNNNFFRKSFTNNNKYLPDSLLLEDTIYYLRKKGDLIFLVGYESILNLFVMVKSNLNNSLSIGLNYGLVFIPSVIDGRKIGFNFEKYLRPNDPITPFVFFSGGLIWKKVNDNTEFSGAILSLAFGWNWSAQNGFNSDLYLGLNLITIKDHSRIIYPCLGIRLGHNFINY